MLNLIETGIETDKPTLLIAHGLYGSARNWGVVAKRLSEDRRVVALDHRNHGDSPREDSQSYADMAADIAEVITHFGAPVDLLGHSMGGKASMVTAIEHPELLRSLIVADIAPVAYSHSQVQFIDAMRAVDLNRVEKRSDALAMLERAGVEDPTLRSFFTQSLDLKQKRWRLNLDVLERDMPGILGFPDLDGQFDGPTLFLSGAQSDYVTDAHRPAIKTLFPKARFARINGAGHWLHAEKPAEFIASVRHWLHRIDAA
ncbi:alpha/beta fold hydrolase [Shimia biformata]|uniref:alpha/beta fold hydrolase n=1 Tax=Shimia biformata TaxID=1294299 RepID=UPI00194E099D|nr:alpha/beta fold hydrolase [Shimia biformata]